MLIAIVCVSYDKHCPVHLNLHADIKFEALFQPTIFEKDITRVLNILIQSDLKFFMNYRDDILNLAQRLENKSEPHCDKNAECLRTFLGQPASLKCWGRISMRKLILRKEHFKSLEERVNSLGIPRSLQKYLVFGMSIFKDSQAHCKSK